MDLTDRYEILQEIARGDFATVHRARDRELAREVAVKQIHEQFLSDPQQLDRFWREAQLLASLQHPNIVTIYDIRRDRGWLILELMRGSLAQGVLQGPIDLEYLRHVLICSLRALQFLHSNGIVHGDVKPSNLLVDRRNSIKVGDFGLARRAACDEGSLLKGTTKYMAPELIADEFGPVGPASDLYSLGFSAYELLCGPQFESLLPGLNAFGRDRQIAWLMWHAAADRRLPEVHRVLDGVPDDLAKIIQNLTQKHLDKRFQSAEEVLRILQTQPPKIGGAQPPTEEQQAESAESARKQRQRRILAASAFAASLVLSLIMLFWGGDDGGVAAETTTIQGTVHEVDPSGRKMWVWPSDGGPQQIIALQKSDEVTISGKIHSPGELRQGDRVTVESCAEERGGIATNRITAFRPVAKTGRVAGIDPEKRIVAFRPESADKQIDVYVPASIAILFNGRNTSEESRVALEDLVPDDRISVTCIQIGSGYEATALSLDRIVHAEGVVGRVDKAKGELTIKPKDGGDSLCLSFDDSCQVAINGLLSFREKPFSVPDLESGDVVAVEHDSRLVRLDAVRTMVENGTIEGVVDRAQVLSIRRDSETRVTPFLVDAETTILLNGEEAPIRHLRSGDRVRVTHLSLDRDRPTARTVTASRPPDRRRWAIIVGVGTYQTAGFPPLEHAIADSQRLALTMTTRFQVPTEQCRLLVDPTAIQLKHGIGQLLSEPGPEPGDCVVVYFAGHGYVDDSGTVHLGTSEFAPSGPAVGGITLQWLIDQLEACPAEEKLVLLDCCQSAWTSATERQPSTNEMLATLAGPRGQTALRTVTAVASTSRGQRGRTDPSGSRGLFGYYLSEAFSGDGDTNRDLRLEVSELFSFLRSRMKAAEGSVGVRQTPVLTSPNDTPPRLTLEAKDAVLALAALLSGGEPKSPEIYARYSAAKKLCGGEVDPDVVRGLLLMKNRDRDGATQQFQAVLLAHPNNLVALKARAWLWCLALSYPGGPRPEMSLDELVRQLHEPANGATPDQYAAILGWVGEIREYVDLIVEGKPAGTESQLQQLDAAVNEQGTAAEDHYNKGRQRIGALVAQFDKQLAETQDASAKNRIRMNRKSLKNYVSFPDNLAVKMVVEGLDR